MEKVSIIGLDIAKSVFQAHGADASGGVVFRKKINRAKLLEFFAELQQLGAVDLSRDDLDESKPSIRMREDGRTG